MTYSSNLGLKIVLQSSRISERKLKENQQKIQDKQP